MFPPYIFFDYYYLVFMVPALLLSLWAQFSVKSAFSKYSKVRTSRNLTGAEAAAQVLRQNGVRGVRIEQVEGNLTDHFDPRTNVIRLSSSVYGSSSVAAAGVAAHEAGHAVQYAEDYFPIKIRSAIVPVTQFASMLSWPLIFLSFILEAAASETLFKIGALLFLFVVFFQLVTLPVELNASRRAVKALEGSGMLSEQELPGAKKVLRAAAMTYLAALITAVAQLLRIFSMRRSRR